MRLFGLDTEDAGAFLDHFGTVAQDTGVPMGELIRQTQVYGPAMKNLGLGANETAAFFGKLHESGVDVRRVMPGLDLAMQKAAKGGVTDLRGHLDDAIESIRNAETDTEALTLASATFGSEGAGRISAAIRTGILPSLADLSSQYENTEGRTRAAYEATVSLGDRLGMLKDRALALVGPVGDAAAGLGSVATGAALAGPQIVSAGAAIGTKLLPLLSGPLGLVAVIGLAAIGIKKFYDSMARKEVDEFAESIEGMSDEVRDNTRAHLENVIAVSRARLENRDFSSQYAVITDQLETAEAKLAALNQTAEAHAEAVEESTAAVQESTAAVAANAEEVASADDSWKEWTAEVERLSAQMDLARRINEEMMSSLTRQSEVAIEDVIGQFGRLGPEAFDLIEPGLVAATEPAMEEVVSLAESFSDDIATALLNGQSVSEALESAFKATAIPGIAKGAGDFIGGIVGMAAGPKIAGLIAGPIGGALAGLASRFLSGVLSSLASAFSGGTAGDARAKGATKFRMTGDGPQYYINGQWVDADGNPVGGGGGGSGSGGGTGTPESPSSNAMGGPVGAGEYSWVGERGPEVVRFGQAGNVTPNHALGGDIVVQIDGEEVARAAARHLPGVADQEGW